MNPYLEHLAQRVADAPDFFACALAAYVRSEHMEDAGLAARLGCSEGTLTHLRLCRMPRAQAALFWQDIEEIARRFSLDAEVLAEVARRGHSLLRMRIPVGDRDLDKGFLLAARDDVRPNTPPKGGES
jgi:hypothetical protein